MPVYKKDLPFQPGDIFFVKGNGWFDKTILWFTALWSKLRGRDDKAEYSHCGVFWSKHQVFETTSTFTAIRGLRENYAGSQIMVWRPSKHLALCNEIAGFAALIPQIGKLYPYWRLFIHAIGLPGLVKGDTMECSVISATYLKAAGWPLKDDPWTYDPDKLSEELANNLELGGFMVFKGSLRAEGYMDEVEAG